MSEIVLLQEMCQPSNTNIGYGVELAYQSAHNGAHATWNTRVLDVQILITKFLYILNFKHKPLPKMVYIYSITLVKMQTKRTNEFRIGSQWNTQVRLGNTFRYDSQ